MLRRENRIRTIHASLALVNDVVIEDQRDGFGSSVVATQLFLHGDKQGCDVMARQVRP